jgi:MarR family transcriptional regulator, transcriptional regulator for hemolysin
MRPHGPPLGLQLAATSKAVGRAFNQALAEHGGSIPTWLVLNALRTEPHRTQLDLARAVGIEGPTLTRHLDGLEEAGLVERRRGTADRRAVQVELTEAGEALHARLLEAVIEFNRRLRSGLSAEDEATLRRLLGQLQENAGEMRLGGFEPPTRGLEGRRSVP